MSKELVIKGEECLDDFKELEFALSTLTTTTKVRPDLSETKSPI